MTYKTHLMETVNNRWEQFACGTKVETVGAIGYNDFTKDEAGVTCLKCLNRLASRIEAAAKKAAPKVEAKPQVWSAWVGDGVWEKESKANAVAYIGKDGLAKIQAGEVVVSGNHSWAFGFAKPE